MIKVQLILLKRNNDEPILTAKSIQWMKFIDYIGPSIKADPSRIGGKTYKFSILVLYQTLHLERPI